MSYDIYIGEAVLHECDVADYEGEMCAEYHVKPHAEDAAPTFENDEMTGNGNSRHPGYGAWGDFADSTGLSAFFFDKFTGLMRKHPGCFALTKKHGAVVRKALADYRRRHPNTKTGFGTKFSVSGGIIMSDIRAMGVADATVAERHMARLLWLDWWIHWALANCKRPAISNS